MGALSSMQPVHRPLVFALNGERVELRDVDPATTVLHYIRSATRFKGPKRSCGEGGCGACLVILAKYDPETREVKESSVNACLVLLCSVDGCAITTTEGLGNQRKGFHAIQKRLSAFHGSQCGYCTPGMTMAIYSCLKHEQQHQSKATAVGKNNGNAPSSGPTCETMERAIQGNICRCTGYRPILDVCKSFASDVDLEDLGLNTCWTDKADAKQEYLPQYDPSGDPAFPQFLIRELEGRKTPIQGHGKAQDVVPAKEGLVELDARFKHVESSREGDEERAWVSATNFAELSAAMKVLKGKRDQVKLVVGNTSSGYYKDIKPQVFVDISQIPELLTVHRDAHSLEIGAATRISELIDHLEEFSPNPIATNLANHLKKLAGGHVRNWGSVGGNLVMAQRFAFESDIATILLGAGASVKLATIKPPHESYSSHNLVPMEEFLATSINDQSTILQSIHIPLTSNTTTIFKTYRGAPRPYGNAVSYANAAFLASVSRNAEGVAVIESTRLAFGAFGTKHAIRAVKVEELLKGKMLNLSLIQECVERVKQDVVPLAGTEKPEYRVALVVGFLFEFLNSLLSSDQAVVPTPLLPHVGKQSINVTDEMYPLTQPTAKILSLLQASGEAVYVDDIPSPPRCLHAAYVLSSEPHAQLKGVDANIAMGSPGAAAFISVKDIPEGGKNVGIVSNFMGLETELLFAEDVVGYAGQPLGVMVADTYDHAKFAAERVHVKYDKKGVEAPILTIDDAVARNSMHPVPEAVKSINHHHIGDTGKALAEAEFQLEGAVSTASQNHFYMETQVALAVPDEDCLTIYTSTQAPDFVQQAVSFCLNLPINKVRIICRRLGGAFGGKSLRNQQVAVAAALAAYTLQRPVRISLDRNTDMQMIGGRVLTKTKFTVGFTKTGKITAAKVDVLLESGWFVDFHMIMFNSMDSVVKKYNFGTFDLSFTFCKTNNVPKTAVRAPGDAQCSTIAEAIVDHVASYLGMSGIKVRDENMHTFDSLVLFHRDHLVGDKEGFTLPTIWSRLKVHARVEEREMEIEKYNKQSKWLKRGLGMVPCVYHVLGLGNTSTVSIFQDGSVVVEVGGVEMGQGLYTKVSQAVAYTLSPLCSKEEVSELLKKIRILQLDTLHLPNSFADGYSTTSEATCAAAQQACVVLVQRLLPVKEELAEAHLNGEVSWESICFTAKFRMMDLQSHQRWVSPIFQYLLYGAGVSEVEVNILTGETRTLATDLIYDAGRSVNSAVDIGQVEGAFVFGLGFYVIEEILRDSKGKVVSDGTWTYKPPTLDIIPQSFNVELYKSPVHKDRIFSSKAVGEPPLLLAGSVYSAIWSAIRAARKDYKGSDGCGDVFEFNTPATMDKVKKLCGMDNVEKYLARVNTGNSS
ncbi:hypothetical protein M758_8G134400 [Ceratodon purpureus]|nr:hypothetical protein M758_8G134400 [Ceratodon purpureus]